MTEQPGIEVRGFERFVAECGKTLFRSDNGMFNWYGEDGQRWFFTPTGMLADELDRIFDS